MAKKFNRIIKFMKANEMLEKIKSKKLNKISSIKELKKIIVYIMDNSDEDKENILKGLDLILKFQILKKAFPKKEINDYIAFAYETYNAKNIKYNPLKQILKFHNYNYKY